MRKTTLEETAHHEAGHARIALWFDVPVTHVTIAPREDSLGHVIRQGFAKRWKPPVQSGDCTPAQRAKLETHILISLAGPAAERRFSGFAWRWSDRYWAGDIRSASENANWITGDDEETNAYLRWMRVRAENLIGSPGVWAQVEAIAQSLLRHTTLNGAQVYAAIRGASLPVSA